jgi:hypothetical protein
MGAIFTGRLIVMCFLGSALCLAASNSKSAETPRPLWSLDLVENLKDAARNPPGIAFLDNDRLLVHEVDFDTSQLSSRQSPDISTPFRLRTSVIDVHSGKTVLTREWGTRSSGSTVEVTSGGIIIRTGDVLRLCSKELVELQQLAIPSVPYEGWEIRISPSGKTVLLNHYHLNRQEFVDSSRLRVLDGDTLKTKFHWAESGLIGNYEITDRLIAATRLGHGQVIATEFGTGIWKPLYELSGENCAPGLSQHFVTNTSMVCGGRKKIAVSSTSGEVLFQDALVKGEGPVRKMEIAQDGHTAAAMLENFSDIWDTGGHITSLRAAVYDLSARKRVMTVVVSPPPKHRYDAALSPDGSKLAILNDHTVSLYAVAH